EGWNKIVEGPVLDLQCEVAKQREVSRINKSRQVRRQTQTMTSCPKYFPTRIGATGYVLFRRVFKQDSSIRPRFQQVFFNGADCAPIRQRRLHPETFRCDLEVCRPPSNIHVIFETIPISIAVGKARFMAGYFNANRALDFSIPDDGREAPAGMDWLTLLVAGKLRKESQAVEDVALPRVVRANQNIEGPQIQRHISQTLVIANVDLVEHTNLSARVIQEVNPYILATPLVGDAQRCTAADLELILH